MSDGYKWKLRAFIARMPLTQGSTTTVPSWKETRICMPEHLCGGGVRLSDHVPVVKDKRSQVKCARCGTFMTEVEEFLLEQMALRHGAHYTVEPIATPIYYLDDLGLV